MDNLALLTDLYQLTMAYGYWKTGIAEKKAVFQMFFRKTPFNGGYAIVAGLDPVLDYIQNWKITEDDIQYLKTLQGNDGEQLFEDDFLNFLKESSLELDVYAMQEGSFVFSHEPIVRVHGPLWQCQMVETAILNIVNFQTLIATKASRICNAAQGQPVLEFALRRAQGIDGALSASRAAYIGGCAATSNVLAGKKYYIPVKGTHAHSWVMCFVDEPTAFQAYADAMPNNCVFLVDTYDTIQGIKNAIKMGQELRKNGHEMVGIRLDSGDLAYLSKKARNMLDEAGFPDAKIVASNDLDEHLINSLKHQDAKINVWGVGTKLGTAYDQPALGGVYKLSAIEDDNGNFVPKLKMSEQTIKTSNPGILQICRFFNDEGIAVGDMIFDTLDYHALPKRRQIISLFDPTRCKDMNCFNSRFMLSRVMTNGIKDHYRNLESIRHHREKEEKDFHDSIKRLENPHEYPVGLEPLLHSKKTIMIWDHRVQKS